MGRFCVFYKIYNWRYKNYNNAQIIFSNLLKIIIQCVADKLLNIGLLIIDNRKKLEVELNKSCPINWALKNLAKL